MYANCNVVYIKIYNFLYKFLLSFVSNDLNYEISGFRMHVETECVLSDYDSILVAFA